MSKAPKASETQVTTVETVITTNDTVGSAPAVAIEAIEEELNGTVITTFVGVQHLADVSVGVAPASIPADAFSEDA